MGEDAVPQSSRVPAPLERMGPRVQGAMQVMDNVMQVVQVVVVEEVQVEQSEEGAEQSQEL